MSTHAHRLRDELRAALAAGRQLVGTFVKLPSTDVVELVRHCDAIGLPALVRIPSVEPALINRILECGAVGIQLSMLATAAQNQALWASVRFAPTGRRSISLANRAADFGAGGLSAYLTAEADSPPLLVGQIETAVSEPWAGVLAGLDVTFVGTTDLSVSLGVVGDDAAVATAVATVAEAAQAAGTAFGGWSGSLAGASAQGLGPAGYLVVGSDLSILRAGLTFLKG